MKWVLPITIAILAVLQNGDVTAQGYPTPPCRARTLDLRAHYEEKWFSGGGDAAEVDAAFIDYCSTPSVVSL